MITEDWTPRNDGQSEDGNNRERKPLTLNRATVGSGGSYNNNGSYNRPRSNYNSYNNSEGGNNYGNSYERPARPYTPRPYNSDGGYNNNGGGYRPRNNYGNNDRNFSREGGYNSGNSYDRPARPYTPRPYNSEGGDDTRKRRARVGEEQQNRYPSSGNRYQSNDRYQSTDRYPSNNRYPNNNNRYPSNGYNRNQTQRFDKYAEIKRSKYREEHFDPNEPLRLNKYLANAGVCSRREADAFITAGVVKVNGVVVTELGTKVKRADEVMFHDQPVRLEAKMYVVLNKPKNCVTTADDPQERLTVMDLVKTACHERIFPVGRLDRNSTGVLLLTNDGDLASKLTHPKYAKKKVYHVWLDKNVTIEDMEKLAKGIDLDDGEIHADEIAYAIEDVQDQVGIEIHSGRNRIVRRMFESLGYRVTKLDRVYFAGMTKKNLKRGHWRYLTEQEVNMLRQGAFE
ncbi:pseudouridine synthase [Bacteroidia bacterium]|nr:pseudouridine synthase [Bacteroidia bacterium]